MPQRDAKGWAVVGEAPFAAPPLDQLDQPIMDDKDVPFDADPIAAILNLANKYVAQPVTRTANSVIDSLGAIPRELRESPFESVPHDTDRDYLHEANKAVQKVGRVAGHGLNVAAAPLTVPAAPVLNALEPGFTALGEATKAAAGGEVIPEVLKATEGMDLAGFLKKVLTTHGAVSTGNENADPLLAMASGVLIPGPKGKGTGTAAKMAPELASPLARAVFEATKAEKGATFNLSRGNLKGTRNFAVSLFPERTVKIEAREVTPTDIQQFIDKNRDLLKDPKVSVGTWVDDAGTTYLDLTATTPSRKVAQDLADRYNQRAIYDLKKGEAIQTGGTGEAPLYADPVENRLSTVPEDFAREPFVGYHYSDVKTDVLRGDLRGQSGVGQEKVRLRDGRGAAPGVYVYGPESVRPEGMIVTRKNRHKVEGDFALADIEQTALWDETISRAVQKNKAAGMDDTQALHAAINETEHELRDAGYDGYYRGKKDIVFLFDDQPVAKEKGGIPRRESLSSELSVKKPTSLAAHPIPRMAKRPSETLPEWKGESWRSPTGYVHRGSAAEVIRYEMEELGNIEGFDFVTPELLKELESRPAADLVWVTRTKNDAERYGTAELEVLPPGSRVLGESDGDGGYLVLKPEFKQEELSPRNGWEPISEEPLN